MSYPATKDVQYMQYMHRYVQPKPEDTENQRNKEKAEKAKSTE
jgi:hypothetical protein